MQKKLRFLDYVQRGQSGTKCDVDQLMQILAEATDLVTIKLVDNALNLVDNREGKQQIRYYLFSGEEIQRNYAALYFKRRGDDDLIREAFLAGKLDKEQAFSR